LNRQELSKSLKRNLWGYELKSMLNEFIDNISEIKQNQKFKVSGKILNSSTYILKRKTNRIINSSLETQDDIKEAQFIENEENDIISEEFIEGYEGNDQDYDEEAELYEAFAALESENLLTEDQKALFKEEKINRALNLDVSEINRILKNKIHLLEAPPKLIYKKVELKDLADALNNILKSGNKIKEINKIKKKKKIDNTKLPFLPENFIANAKQKRADFEKRINYFYDSLKSQYNGEPISFLHLVAQPSAKALVDTLLIILHLINHKKVEIWKSYVEKNSELKEFNSENNGTSIYLSPLN